jgi:hypothetical protein
LLGRIALILNTGEHWEPEQEDIIKWQQLYPKVDVFQELNAMEGWLDANPKKRKTKRGIKTFCNSWLSRAQDKGGSPMVQNKINRANSTKDMTELDHLSHNFVGCPQIRANFLDKYGQCFENGERITK